MFKIILAIFIIGYIVIDMYADIHMSDEDRMEKDQDIWANYYKILRKIHSL
jgi:hypothetical protein